MDYFKIVLTVQLFYAVGITMLLYAISLGPASLTLHNGLGAFQNLPNTDISQIQSKVTGSFTNQTSLPLADLGSLVYFSGFVLMDLLANFVLAVPSMVQLLLTALFWFVPVDATFQALIVTFLTILVGIIYFLGLLALFTNIASRGAIVQ